MQSSISWSTSPAEDESTYLHLTRLKNWLILMLILLLSPLVANAEDPEEKKREWIFDGFALENYRFRHATSPYAPGPQAWSQQSDESDHDLRFILAGNLTEDTDHFEADLSLGLWADVDGEVPNGEPSSFGSIYSSDNNLGHRVWFDIYSASVEYRSRGTLSYLRGGRQVSEHGRLVTFDGAALEIRASKPYLNLFVFGGRSVHFFDVDANLFEDWLASGGVVVRPLPSLRLELDYRFIKEDTEQKEGLIEHSYGAVLWYDFEQWLYLHGYFRGIDDRPSHTGGSLKFEWSEMELGLDTGADAQLVILREVSESEDVYLSVLGPSLPHVRLRANLWKAFTTGFGTYTIHGGWNSRLMTQYEQTEFNRDYGRLYLLVQATDIWVKGPFVGVVGEYNFTHEKSDLSKDSFFTVGGSLGYDIKLIKAEAGTYYSRYKYNYYVDINEMEDVRTYFGEVRYRPLDWLFVKVKYEFERFDRDIHTATLTLTQTY